MSTVRRQDGPAAAGQEKPAPATPSQTLDELRRRLTAGHFSGGRLPPERSLADDLGIGRRALREALDVLETEGRIWRRQGQGTFVGARPSAVSPGIGTDELSERISPIAIMEARLTMEPVLARLTAMRASTAGIAQLADAAIQTASADNAVDYERFDRSFHRKIAELADNALFLVMFDLIAAVRQRAAWAQMRANSFSPARVERLSGEHAAILAAITERDPAGAEQAMRRHLREVAMDLVGMDPLPVIGRASSDL